MTDPITQTYNDCLDLIRDTVWSFIRVYPWNDDFEELFSQANLHFMQAYTSYKPNQIVLFSTWARKKIFFGLFDTNKNQMRRYKQAQRRPRILPQPIPSDVLIDLIDELGVQGKELLTIYKESLGDFEKLLKSKSKKKTRKALYEYLKDENWSRQDIQIAFNNLQQAMTK